MKRLSFGKTLALLLLPLSLTACGGQADTVTSSSENSLVQASAADYTVASWQELVEAVYEAKDGQVVQLSADITDAGKTASDTVDAVSTPTLKVDKDLTIDGNGKTISAYAGEVLKTTLDQQGNTVQSTVQASFCFALDGGAKRAKDGEPAVAGGKNIAIKNLTIDGASFSDKLGGAVYVESDAVAELENVTIKNSKALSRLSSNSGGAIYVEPHAGTSATLKAVNCSFEDNAVNDGTTGRGGAIGVMNGKVTLENCHFSGNQAAFGGAVAAAGESELSIIGCTFEEDNQSVFGGQDIYLFDGYTYYKKTMAVDSAVRHNLQNNIFKGKDGADYTSYRLVRGSVLGDIVDTTSNEAQVIELSTKGAGTDFSAEQGHGLVFSDYTRQGVPEA